MASITERRNRDGSVTYRVQVRLTGHAPVFGAFDKRTDAKRFAQETEVALRAKGGRADPRAGQRTLGMLIDEYIEILPVLHLKRAKDQKQQLGWWKDRLGKTRLSDLTPMIIGSQ